MLHQWQRNEGKKRSLKAIDSQIISQNHCLDEATLVQISEFGETNIHKMLTNMYCKIISKKMKQNCIVTGKWIYLPYFMLINS